MVAVMAGGGRADGRCAVSAPLVSVEYHGPQWSLLVEQGWVTATVDTLTNGTRIARMIYCPAK